MPAQTTAAGAPSHVEIAPRSLALVSATVMLGVIMAIIDATIVNVALDKIAGNLGASIDEVAWVATGYILSALIVMPLNGWLTAALGRKRFYAICVAIFTLASLLCGTATNIWQLVFYRIIQGFGGGALQPTAQAIMFESFPRDQRGKAMAIFGMAAMAGPAIGPLLGGYLVANYDWPLIFFINIPLGVIAFLMTLAYIEDPPYRVKPAGSFDYLGLGSMVLGLGSLQYVLERGQHDDWFNSPTIVILSITAVGGLITFIAREIMTRYPLVDLRIFKNRSFAAGNVISIVSGFGLFGLSLVLPLFMQTLLGWDAWQTGFALLPGAIATALSMVVVGRLSSRIDPRVLMGAGLIVFGIGSWVMGYLYQNAGYWDLFWPRAAQGFGIGLLFVPLTVVTMSSVPLDQTASASGLLTLVRQLGGSLGIAALTTYLQSDTASVYAGLSSGVNTGRAVVGQTLAQLQAFFEQHGYAAVQAHALALAQIAQTTQLQANAIAYENLFRISGVLFFMSLFALLLLANPKVRGGASAQQVIAPD